MTKTSKKLLSQVMTELANRAVKKRHAGMTKAQKRVYYSEMGKKRWKNRASQPSPVIHN